MQEDIKQQDIEEIKRGSDPFLRLPYGLAKQKGISTEGLTPRQVWELLKGIGINPKAEMAKLKEKLDGEIPQAPQDEPEQFFADEEQKEQGLNADLIKRANNSSFLYEAGSAISHDYMKFAQIVKQSHFDQTQKNQILDNAQKLFNAELQAKANAPHWAVTGRGNLNQSQYQKTQNKADIAYGERSSYTNKIVDEIKKYENSQKTTAQNKALTEGISKAEAEGKKEVTINGTTYYKLRTNWTTKTPAEKKQKSSFFD